MDTTQEFLDTITKNDIEKASVLLNEEPSLNRAKDNNGVSAILLATYYGRKEIAELLLNSGLELDAFEASATGQTERLKRLLQKDPSLVNQYSNDGFFPLGLASYFGHKGAVIVLLENGADVKMAANNPTKVTSMHAAASGQHVEIAQILIQHGVDVNARQQNSYTPLHSVAASGSVEFAKLLIDNGADLNTKSDDGKTALSMAVERKKSEMEAFLRQLGAN
ncbi:MAG TPA: ankyrin repeat domain-containing protein [Blastocatellia bacterium]|nr:ankyrin repeat domain-containing protein [Blastocatellia bacterium]